MNNLTKGFLAGAAGGVVGAGFKLICEAIVPPRPPGREAPPVLLVSHLLEKYKGHPLPEANTLPTTQAIHWSFSVLAGGLYGALAESVPLVTTGGGSVFGALLWAGAHQAALPALDLSPSVPALPVSEQINESLTHSLYGIVVEQIRRTVRKRLE
ncbi:MAG: DUF1440 domain-containing protein [Janthinobacterium lividum]